jgi:hypothetical protein
MNSIRTIQPLVAVVGQAAPPQAMQCAAKFVVRDGNAADASALNPMPRRSPVFTRSVISSLDKPAHGGTRGTGTDTVGKEWETCSEVLPQVTKSGFGPTKTGRSSQLGAQQKITAENWRTFRGDITTAQPGITL